LLIFGTEASGETAFLGIALWEIRIFKRKNAKPRNAKTPPRGPSPAQDEMEHSSGKTINQGIPEAPHEHQNFL
jgi:hypothetical protein